MHICIEVKISECFSKIKLKSHWNSKKDLGGGTILDLGIYTIQLCQWIFQQEPQTIRATGELNEDGVDVDMSAEITYGNNKVGKIKTSAVSNLSNTATIVGTKGTMTVNEAFLFSPLTF